MSELPPTNETDAHNRRLIAAGIIGPIAGKLSGFSTIDNGSVKFVSIPPHAAVTNLEEFRQRAITESMRRHPAGKGKQLEPTDKPYNWDDDGL